MPISKHKQAQTAINLLHTRVAKPVARAAEVAGLIRQAVIDNDLTGEFSAGELSALASFVASVEALAASPVVTALANRYAATHRNAAMTIAGVNDNG